jgi:hypothetical protein
VIVDRGLPAHARIYKYLPEITSLPWGQKNYFLPYRTVRKIFSSSCDFVHLARLTPENRKLRGELRNRQSNSQMKMRRINKRADEISQTEYNLVMKSPNFIYFKDYNGDPKSIPLTIL